VLEDDIERINMDIGSVNLIIAEPLIRTIKSLVQCLYDNDLVGCDHEAGICNCFEAELITKANQTIKKVEGFINDNWPY
jgi:hypothetical protein